MLPGSSRRSFAIAAAATWAVLHLCGTPWLKGDCHYEEAFQTIQLGLAGEGAGKPEIYDKPLVGIFRVLKTSSTAISENTEPETAEISEPSQSSPDQDPIHAKMIFALGILLIELCFGVPIEINQELHQTQLP